MAAPDVVALLNQSREQYDKFIKANAEGKKTSALDFMRQAVKNDKSKKPYVKKKSSKEVEDRELPKAWQPMDMVPSADEEIKKRINKKGEGRDKAKLEWNQIKHAYISKGKPMPKKYYEKKSKLFTTMKRPEYVEELKKYYEEHEHELTEKQKKGADDVEKTKKRKRKDVIDQSEQFKDNAAEKIWNELEEYYVNRNNVITYEKTKREMERLLQLGRDDLAQSLYEYYMTSRDEYAKERYEKLDEYYFKPDKPMPLGEVKRHAKFFRSIQYDDLAEVIEAYYQFHEEEKAMHKEEKETQSKNEDMDEEEIPKEWKNKIKFYAERAMESSQRVREKLIEVNNKNKESYNDIMDLIDVIYV